MKKTCILLAITLLAACGEDDNFSTTRTTTVHPGQSIQAAIDAAAPNTIIIIEPGVYHESATQPNAVTISRDGIQLIGHPTPGNPVVLENVGGQQSGIVVAPADSVSVDFNVAESPGEHPPCGENGNMIHGFVAQGLTVRGFDEFGMYLACVDNFTLANNVADADLRYGLFPVRSQHGTLSKNEAHNTTLDAALYIGQSNQITLTSNTSHDNLLGMEIENSSNITATDNDLFNNTLGLIADVMPGLQKKDQVGVTIANNRIHDNNLPNANTEGQTSQTPPGTGMVILGSSMVTVQDNTVTNNGFAGIIMVSYCTGISPCAGLDIDPDPSHNRIVDNIVSNNGTHPPSDPFEAALAADMIWDKTGSGNCWAGNSAAAKVKILGGGQLPACQ